ncbi:MAG: hypothetical protein RIS05_767 [Actinomycetota bacterium]|jgi:hypothetical protein
MRARTAARLLILALLLGASLPISSTAGSASTDLQLFQPCTADQKYSCIEYFGVINSKGVAIAGKTVGAGRDVGPNDSFAGQNRVGLSYEWQTPGVIHENGNDRVFLKVFYFPKDLPYCYSSTAPCDTGVDEIVFEVGGAWWGNQPKPIDFPGLSDNRQCGTKTAPTVCIRGWGINEDVEYVVRVRAPQNWEISHAVGEGRNGIISMSSDSQGINHLEFKASPARRSVSYQIISPRVVDTTTKADATWSALNVYVQGVKSNSSQWLAKCNYARGMSIWHNGNLQSYPSWSASDQALSLTVEAAHLQMDGSANVGTFNVAMPLTVANCLWNVDLSKTAQATVSASYPELGISEIVTTSSKITNGTYILTASGFHYSAPTIKVKVNQVKEVTKPKVTSIICVKGKIKRTVSAVRPVCPKGFVKK